MNTRSLFRTGFAGLAVSGLVSAGAFAAPAQADDTHQGDRSSKLSKTSKENHQDTDVLLDVLNGNESWTQGLSGIVEGNDTDFGGNDQGANDLGGNDLASDNLNGTGSGNDVEPEVNVDPQVDPHVEVSPETDNSQEDSNNTDSEETDNSEESSSSEESGDSDDDVLLDDVLG